MAPVPLFPNALEPQKCSYINEHSRSFHSKANISAKTYKKYQQNSGYRISQKPKFNFISYSLYENKHVLLDKQDGGMIYSVCDHDEYVLNYLDA